ncbi:Leucine rich repeat N-terminal domain/Leucine rich repeat/Leucine Rich Repeat [Novymonas esmeraldas]|uniref:Leucine rich repeat N-terminal domain/Leucine rich repeat/Leucine Rich Repeat n=1 Tax=Novymonas esmeraldas TaxID=1808958 RepID=A0AAW0EY80_9TRYP
MSTRRPHLHGGGATPVRAAAVLPLLLLVACAVACPLCVRAVDTSSYTVAERTNTLAFLQSFVTPGSTLADAWTGTNFCTWKYVTCEYSSMTLDLQALRPTAPLALPELADSVDGASVLLTRILAGGLGSSLSGTLPASWGRLTRLREVQLGQSALTGPLPTAWGSLTGLRKLNLGGNALSGTLPAEWGSLVHMTTLDLSRNSLTGRIPALWGSMTELEELHLNDNQLTGSLPGAVSVLWLNTVDISNNQLCGCAPRRWDSSYNARLTADPPLTASDCMKANACAVDESSTPAERATLAFLQGFAVSMPSLQSTWADTRYCTWPGVVCDGYDTVALDFSALSLGSGGSLPELSESVDGSLVSVNWVRISGKSAMVSGSLPASWGRLTRLMGVMLVGNALTGPLPAEWGSLTGLWMLELSSNELSGTVPAAWAGLRSMRYWYVNGNQLTGSIPAEMGLLTPWTVDISNNELCGCVPSQWTSSSDITLTADSEVRASDCAAANACAAVTTGITTTTRERPMATASAAGPSSGFAPDTSADCDVIGCARCAVGAAHVCAQCQPGYALRGTNICQPGSSGTAGGARAGAVVAAVTCAVLASSAALVW